MKIEPLKKILIISYFYPPCNLTASQRVGGWVKYLSSFGYYPIVITRNWDIPIFTPEDALISSGINVVHEKNDNFEVYYLPYKASFRDVVFSKNKGRKVIQKISKLHTFKDLLFENVSNKTIPFSNMYDFSKEIIEKDSSIKLLIISGNPYSQFKFGDLLHKNFGIKWIADYRDEWNTSAVESKMLKSRKIISTIQSKNEKKWVSSAECITSVSKVCTDRISQFVQKDGMIILNGFDGIDENEIIEVEKNVFNITYNGSLYPTQPIEILLQAFIKVIQNEDVKINVNINFPGLGFDPAQRIRVEQQIVGFEKFFHITDRISKNDVIQIQKRSDLLLMVTHKGIKGIPSSKMYEYIGLKKQILLYPNDHDIVEGTLNETGLGIICKDENEVYLKLLGLVKAKQDGLNPELKIDPVKIDFYSRKNQTAELAKLLDRLISH
jgi:hypothetical protein